MATNYKTADISTVTPNLVGHWKMNDNSTTTLADSSGNGYTLTNQEGTPTVTATASYVLWPAAGNDDYFINTDLASLVSTTVNDSHIITARYHVETAIPAANHVICGTKATDDGVYIALDGANGDITYVYDAGAQITQTTANAIHAADTDYFVAAGYDATTDKIFIWTSANKVLTYNKTNTIDTDMTTGATGFMIGGRTTIDNPTDTRIWDVQYYQKNSGGLPSNYLDIVQWMSGHEYYNIPAAWWA